MIRKDLYELGFVPELSGIKHRPIKKDGDDDLMNNAWKRMQYFFWD